MEKERSDNGNGRRHTDDSGSETKVKNKQETGLKENMEKTVSELWRRLSNMDDSFRDARSKKTKEAGLRENAEQDVSELQSKRPSGGDDDSSETKLKKKDVGLKGNAETEAWEVQSKILVNVEDSSSGARGKKKKDEGLKENARKDVLGLQCRICGGAASGYYFHALTCKGCKLFFMLSASKAATYTCKFGHRCEKDKRLRKMCKACRLKKCREEGMREADVVVKGPSSPQAGSPSKSRRTHSGQREPVSEEGGAQAKSPLKPKNEIDEKCEAEKPLMTKPSVENEDNGGRGSSPVEAEVVPPLGLLSIVSDAVDAAPLFSLLGGHQELLRPLVTLLQEFTYLDHQGKPGQGCRPPADMTPADLARVLSQMKDRFLLHTFHFSQSLPGFPDVRPDERHVLLSWAATETMALHVARHYSADSGTILLTNGYRCSLPDMLAAGFGRFAELLFDYCPRLAPFRLDPYEVVFLTALSVFADRPHLSHKQPVRVLRREYLRAFQAYEAHKERAQVSALQKLVMCVDELRFVAIAYRKLPANLRTTAVDLEELLEAAQRYAAKK